MQFRSLMLLIVFTLCLPFALAQDKAQPQSEKSAKQAQGSKQKKTVKEANPPGAPGMEMPKPSPEIQKLVKTFQGTWSTAEKHESSPMMPAGSSKGTATFKPGPGGFSLTEDYREIGGMGFTGLGIFSWDPKSQAYKAYWCDSMTPSGCESSGAGKWDGGNLVFEGDVDMGGTQTHMKNVYTDIKPDSFTYNMFLGDPNKPVMTIKYTKKGGAAKPAGKPSGQ